MNITKFVPVGILAVIIVGGIGAYLFLYPQEEKVSRAVVAPKAPPRVAAPVAPPPVAAPVSAPVATPSVATPVQVPQSPLKLSENIKTANKPSKPSKTTSKPKRPKDSDLRDCLKLETDAAIAKCAGE